MQQTAYAIAWIGYWPDLGAEDDGHSLHASAAAAARRLAFEATRHPLKRTPEGPARAVQINDHLARKLAIEGELYYQEGHLALVLRPDGTCEAVERKHQPVRHFVELCLAGRVMPEDAQSFVERWKTGVTPNLSLAEFLGLTPEELAAFEQHPLALYRALFQRQQALNSISGQDRWAAV